MNWKIVVILIFVLIIGRIIGVAIFRGNSNPSNNPPMLSQMLRMAAQINKELNLPVMIDKETEMMPMHALPGRIFLYNFRLVNTLNEEFSGEWEEVAEEWRPKILNMACSWPQTHKIMAIDNIKLRFSYYDKEHKYLFTVNITPEAC